MILQKEQLTDYWEVENLYDVCFTYTRLSLSSYRLRKNAKPISDLCFVARDETKNLIAAIRYWPIKIGNHPSLLLGPIAVHPTRQGEGHARYIINHSLKEAELLGWEVVILIGDLSYYQQFNFNIAKNLNFPQPTNKKRILIKSLNRFNTDGLKGTVNKY
ncbi:MAG: GNAT family N-acetyltransferase [Paracoccaceae bacterium]